MKHLYIIGNGFDLHHRIPSCYSDFEKWLKSSYPEIYSKMTDIYALWRKPSWWNEFETNLGDVSDIRIFAELTGLENQPDFTSDNRRDWYSDEALIAMESELGGLVEDLRNCFQEWTSTLPLGDVVKAITIEKADSLFLTFNYTLTLERLYCIPKERVLHIHGSVLEKESIVFGHGREYADIRGDLGGYTFAEPPDNLPNDLYNQRFDEQGVIQTDNIQTAQAKDAAAEAIYEIHKDVDGIISRNQVFFQNIRDVVFIHIYGFSFGSIDIPYLMEIAKNVRLEAVEFVISYHSETDIQRAQDFLKELRPCPKKVSFVQLGKIKRCYSLFPNI